jgi:phosphoribosylglycinamide formyltransferase 2
MSSSGKGQSTVRGEADIERAWNYSQQGGRAGAGRVIVEGFVEFDYEITLLTVRHRDGTSFCPPIGHLQVEGDYRESWQPQPMTTLALERAQQVAEAITGRLGGHGIFGVELFVRGDEVLFSEVSPRPHDTGLVTLVSQDLSEFALHVRAILDLPVPVIRQRGPSASCAILGEGESSQIRYAGVSDALVEPDTELRLFGKPEIRGRRRLGVALARGESLEEARARARRVAEAVRISL